MRRIVEDSLMSVAPGGEQHGARVAILAVGDTEAWLRKKRPVPPGGRIILASFSDLSHDLLARIRPALVVSPLLARDFDCIDLAQMLHALGYGGRYRVISDHLPDPRIVLAEIRSQCPGLDFDVLQPSAVE